MIDASDPDLRRLRSHPGRSCLWSSDTRMSSPERTLPALVGLKADPGLAQIWPRSRICLYDVTVQIETLVPGAPDSELGI